MAGSGDNGNLPVISTGWGASKIAFDGRPDFWSEVDRLRRDNRFEEALDLALDGQSSPRVWLIMHPVSKPELGVAAAMGFAGEISRRGLAAVVLDGDEDESALTRWIERTESEGWIDLVRYGTSVLTSGVDMPGEGRTGYVLGVGSFTPTGVTPQEMETLVGRLRRQADDLILVAPVGVFATRWAHLATIRLLCWDRAGTSSEEIGALVSELVEQECPPTALVGFGVQDLTHDVAVPKDAPVEEAASEADRVAEEKLVEQQGLDRENESGWEDPPLPAPTDERPRGTSGVFWLAAVVVVVALVAIGFYYFKFMVIPGEPEPVRRPVAQQTRTDPPTLAGAEESRAGNDSLAPFAQGADVGDESTVALADDVAESVAVDEGPMTDGTLDEATADLDEVQPPVITEEQAASEPEEIVEEVPAKPAFDMAPYRVPVGEGGWALHLFSMPDRANSDKQVRELKRQRFETAVIITEIPGKGQWWRIYLGSFASRDEARAARPLLLEKLGHDWANPVNFQALSRE